MHPINPGSDNKFPFGDYTARVPPLPIPNREVKPCRADDTWWLTHGKVGRRQGFFNQPAHAKRERVFYFRTIAIALPVLIYG